MGRHRAVAGIADPGEDPGEIVALPAGTWGAKQSQKFSKKKHLQRKMLCPKKPACNPPRMTPRKKRKIILKLAFSSLRVFFALTLCFSGIALAFVAVDSYRDRQPARSTQRYVPV